MVDKDGNSLRGREEILIDQIKVLTKRKSDKNQLRK